MALFKFLIEILQPAVSKAPRTPEAMFVTPVPTHHLRWPLQLAHAQELISRSAFLDTCLGQCGLPLLPPESGPCPAGPQHTHCQKGRLYLPSLYLSGLGESNYPRLSNPIQPGPGGLIPALWLRAPPWLGYKGQPHVDILYTYCLRLSHDTPGENPQKNWRTCNSWEKGNTLGEFYSKLFIHKALSSLQCLISRVQVVALGCGD